MLKSKVTVAIQRNASCAECEKVVETNHGGIYQIEMFIPVELQESAVVDYLKSVLYRSGLQVKEGARIWFEFEREDSIIFGDIILEKSNLEIG